MQIRPFTESDGDEVVRLFRYTTRFVNNACYSERQIQALLGEFNEEWFLESLRTHNSEVAVKEDEVVGFAAFKLEMDRTRTCILKSLYTHHAFQGIGVGSALLRVLEETATQQGFSKVVLNSTPSAVDFYRRRGYLGGMEAPHWIDDVKIEYLNMVKLLVPERELEATACTS